MVAGVDDHSSLIAALKKYMDQESRLKELVNAHEELKHQELKVKEMKEEKKKAMENFIRTNPRFDCVRNHNTRLTSIFVLGLYMV